MMIVDQREEMFELFEESQVDLNDESYKPSHKAKRLIFDIENYFKLTLSEVEYASELRSDELAIIEVLRIKLSEYQDELRDLKVKSINEKFNGYL